MTTYIEGPFAALSQRYIKSAGDALVSLRLEIDEVAASGPLKLAPVIFTATNIRETAEIFGFPDLARSAHKIEFTAGLCRSGDDFRKQLSLLYSLTSELQQALDAAERSNLRKMSRQAAAEDKKPKMPSTV